MGPDRQAEQSRGSGARRGSAPHGLTGRELRSAARVRRARVRTTTSHHVAPPPAPVVGPAAAPSAGEPAPAALARLGKFLVDRLGALLVILLCLPVLLALAVAVKLSSPGPVFYRQTRVGLHGRRFDFLKFRTMVDNADELRDGLLGLNDCDGLLFKMREDPRVTPVGRFMRRWSLDELPQLLHVLLGDMSLVGPRPSLPSEADAYDERAARRLVVKPGLTGLWQVSGRSDLSWDRSVELDLHYVDNWSLRMDLSILVRTVPAVMTARGAY